MKKQNIAYVKHPVSKEEVNKIRADGFNVVDLKFKPSSIGKDDKVFDGKPKPKRKAVKKKESSE
ncbi:MAG: hypothetical protein GY712_04165 [Oceanicoccus sp.]|uniref:hypothetical protein n=1 Tax=Oceanicoccus sp. TaxID=2691044 RepID=UPI00262EFA94|nr:hypothetical protein [Oceanicoccus sp.]MCP3907192.1 hypothetical protein [Oceanicoccus sp.]